MIITTPTVVYKCDVLGCKAYLVANPQDGAPSHIRQAIIAGWTIEASSRPGQRSHHFCPRHSEARRTKP